MIMLSPHFSRDELKCQCCGRVGRFPKRVKKVVACLEKLREAVQKPVNITSWYRCPKHNENVGGVRGSYHTKDMAVDLWVEGYGLRELAYLAGRAGFGGRGRYWNRGIVHCDLGAVRDWDEYR